MFRHVSSCGRRRRTAPKKQSQTKLEAERKKGKMNLETLKDLYVNELRDLYNAENQLTKALPKMAKGASSDELKEAFEKHLEQTKGHVQRLEEVFEDIDEKPKGKTCQAMKGLIEEGSEVLKADGEDSVIDAGLIVAAQKVEHYEIAGYGSLRTFAQLLGKDKSAELLQQTLDEESETNELLNKLAEDIVNPEALMEPELASASSDR
jgi:ferritin-like metal-binding protein YciE